MDARPRFFWLLCVVCALCAFARADELKLRDGTKITGIIVGFEDDHFKVETNYGFALVRRDRVAAITMSDAGKAASARNPAAPSNAPGPAPSVVPSAAPPAAPQTPSPTSASSTPAAPASLPPAPRIREEVDGNTYTNHTYGFRLYKPPSWQVIEGAHRSLPNAVLAMGTGDETTLLVVGREPLRGSLQSQAAMTERRLGEIYENYRSLGDEATTVAGLPAVSRRFRGTVEGRDWSGRVVWVAQGSDVFTIFGMTYADSDLIQIQENVIARTIASLEFIAPR
jgi:hypothetical protein